ncbi:MAG TPA: hypothetical protein VL181_11435 [Holophagaceae bacterium]|nr:hypothetical protein [Holophagaceae bacterium]
MKLAALFLIAALLPAQQPLRRAIAPSAANGWARVVVDDDGAEGIWISDAEGRSVPFLWEADAHWSSIPLAVAHPIWGKDAKGGPTGAFTLQSPAGFTRGDREQVRLDFSLQAAASPWTCEVKVERRGDGGAFVALDDAPRFLYDLGIDRRATSITIPWDADDWRVTLIPVQGAAPKLLGVSASACTLPSELKADETRALPIPSGKDRGHANLSTWFRFSFPHAVRITALQLHLRPPVAPVEVSALRSEMAGGGPVPMDSGVDVEREAGTASLWNLPALGTEASQIPLDGSSFTSLRILVPGSVEVDSASALIRHRRLFFPAEAGQAYFLHGGGLAKVAPGSLGELPASSRAFYAGAPLALGAPEADPQAVAAAPDPAAKLRRWLPWGVGALILLLGLWGLRLLKAPQD